MNRIKTSKIFMALSVCVLTFSFVYGSMGAVYRQGDSGDTVKEIQTRLKKWGYYSGNTDGIFGSRTKEAVKYFQRKNGLTADGVVGKATLAALGISSSSTPSSSTDNDLYLLSRMISAEARGEPYEGQVAVGAVIMNRVKHPSFPDTISGVLFQPGAFSALAEEIKKRGLNIMAYSGYTYEELTAMKDPEVDKLLSMVDWLVDGRFIQDQRDLTLLFRGSANQRVIDMEQTRQTGQVVLDQKYV